MPKKTRRRRNKDIGHSGAKPLLPKGDGHSAHPPPPGALRIRAVSSALAATEQAERYKYVASDLKRTAIVAGVIFLLLILLYFLLR